MNYFNLIYGKHKFKYSKSYIFTEAPKYLLKIWFKNHAHHLHIEKLCH